MRPHTKPHTVIIGAGIVGAALADALSRAGARVTVIDRAAAGGGATATSLAWFNANHRQPHSYHEFCVSAIAEWRQLAGGFGTPQWFQPTGNLTWADTGASRARLAARAERLEGLDYPLRRLTETQAHELEPHVKLPPAAEIVFYPYEGFVEGCLAVQALLERARAHGAQLIEHDEVTRIQLRHGRVSAVRLRSGATMSGDLYVCCPGWRTCQLLDPIGVTVPLTPADVPGATPTCLVAAARTPRTGPKRRPSQEMSAGLVHRVVQGPQISLRPRMCGPCGNGAASGGSPAVGHGDVLSRSAHCVRLEARDLNAQADLHTPAERQQQLAEALLDRARAVYPALADSAIEWRRLCPRPMPLDGHPIADRAPGIDNLYVAVTHSGITLAPLLAKLISQELLACVRAPSLTPYRFDRFRVA